MYSREQMLRVCIACEQFGNNDSDLTTAAMIRQLIKTEEQLTGLVERASKIIDPCTPEKSTIWQKDASEALNGKA